MVSRRTLLVGGAAVAVSGLGGGVLAVDRGVLPGGRVLDGALGRCDVAAPVPDGPLAVREDRAFVSEHLRGREVPWTLLTPPGVPVEGLPVVLVLPGRGGSSRSVVDVLRGDAFLPDAVRTGTPPHALVGVDCGTAYWHPRAGGEDPLAMLGEELLPRLARRGLDPTRLGALGWSMGGYGALLLARESAAGRLPRVRVRAAAAGSPALFTSWEATSEGSFDGPEDFARWGALADDPGTGPVPVSLDCGDRDPFVEGARRYRERRRPVPAGRISTGCHDGTYWRSLAPAQLRFLGGHLA